MKLPKTPLPHQIEPDWNVEPYGDNETPTNEPFEADLVDAATINANSVEAVQDPEYV